MKKNVLVIGRFVKEGFATHIRDTLLDMGYNVQEFVPDGQPIASGGKLIHRINQARRVIDNILREIPKFRAKQMEKLWKLVDNTNLSYIIVCHDFLQPAEIMQLKKLTQAKIGMWFPDALVNFGKGYFMNAPYDGLFFKDPFIPKALFNVLQSPVYYMPECFNPKLHRLTTDEIHEKYKCDITTAGNAHSWRVAFYEHLAKYDVKIWGPRAPLWMPLGKLKTKFQNHLVYYHEKAQAFLGAKIVVNNLHYGEIWGLNVRTFEAAGIGAFQLVDSRLGLAQLFEEGKEIVSFSSLEDMHQKIQYFLEHPELRHQIAQAGKLRAYKDHTYELRLKLILDTLDGNASGYPIML